MLHMSHDNWFSAFRYKSFSKDMHTSFLQLLRWEFLFLVIHGFHRELSMLGNLGTQEIPCAVYDQGSEE